jgi:hypothetical protein
MFGESQLLRSIFESIYAVSNAEIQRDIDTASSPNTEESTKGDSIA